MTEAIIAGAAFAAAVGLALWRPGITVMAVGVFLFAQSALVRVGALPHPLTSWISRADEIVLAALVVRVTYTWLRARTPPFPRALLALALFVVIGLTSALLNGVGPLATGLGIYLALKAGLWLWVGLNLTVDAKVVARYAFLIGALFLGVVGVAALQVAGVPLPWQPTTRAGVIAATSIWDFHTAFGGALSVAVALSIAAARLPGERVSAAILAVSGIAGVLLSTARRLLVSLSAAALAAVFTLPVEGRRYLRSLIGLVRRPAVLLVLVVALGLTTVTVGPRMVDLATLTWNRYVLDLTTRDRYRLYEGAVHLVEQSPLFGRGPATYGSYASVVVKSPAYKEVGYQRPRASMVVGGQIASVVAEYGILGFAAFAAFLVLLVRALAPIARGSSGTIRAALATGGIFMITDMVIESAVNPVFSNSFITFFTFVGIGVALKLGTAAKDNGDEDRWHADMLSRRWRAASLAAAFLFLAVLGGLIAWVVQH